MIAGTATLLILTAGLLIMISGALSESAGQQVRRRAGLFVLIAIALPLIGALLASLPRALVVGALIVASILAFLVLEARNRDLSRARPGVFVNYRASGKVPVQENDLNLGAPRDTAVDLPDDELP